MIGFLIKKGFFDIWDNLVSIVVMNLGYLAVLGLVVLSSYVGETSVAGGYAILAMAILYLSLYSLGISGVTFGLSRYKKLGFRAFKDAFKDHFTHALLHFVLCMAIVLCFIFVIPFYFSMQNMLGLCLGMLLFWVVFALILALQFYYPLCFHYEADNPKATLKKCFGIFADNIGTSFFLVLRTIIDAVLTVLTASLIPGLAGIGLSRMDTVRLLMKKYEFLANNPGTTKKDINWDDLLDEERELVGPRSIRNMIFPWKD